MCRSTTTRPHSPSRAAAARVPRDGGRLRSRLPAHAAGRLDGRQREAQLAAGLDGQGQGRTDLRRRRARLRRAVRQPRLLETDLLEKWARDAKILDIFEGTQQIQLLIIARPAARQDLSGTAVALTARFVARRAPRGAHRIPRRAHRPGPTWSPAPAAPGARHRAPARVGPLRGRAPACGPARSGGTAA